MMDGDHYANQVNMCRLCKSTVGKLVVDIQLKKVSNYIKLQRVLLISEEKLKGPTTSYIFEFSYISEVDMHSACGSNGTEMIVTPRNKTVITTPNHPNIYPNNLICRWHIKANDGHRIELRIDGGAYLEEKYVY